MTWLRAPRRWHRGSPPNSSRRDFPSIINTPRRMTGGRRGFLACTNLTWYGDVAYAESRFSKAQSHIPKQLRNLIRRRPDHHEKNGGGDAKNRWEGPVCAIAVTQVAASLHAGATSRF